jgi:hypothetical protein
MPYYPVMSALYMVSVVFIVPKFIFF